MPVSDTEAYPIHPCMQMCHDGPVTETISPRREKTRQRLLAAAKEVIAEVGLAGASVEVICDRAGFTRGAFYSNFSDKEAMALTLLEEMGSGQIAAASAAIAEAVNAEPDDGDAASLIERALGAFVAAQPSDAESLLLAAELRLHAVRSPDFGRAYAAFEHEANELFARTITETLEARGLTLRLDAERTIRLLHAVHEFAGLEARLHNEETYGGGADLRALLESLISEK